MSRWLTRPRLGILVCLVWWCGGLMSQGQALLPRYDSTALKMAALPNLPVSATNINARSEHHGHLSTYAWLNFSAPQEEIKQWEHSLLSSLKDSIPTDPVPHSVSRNRTYILGKGTFSGGSVEILGDKQVRIFVYTAD